MIVANLRSGYEHIIGIAVHLRLPGLRSILEEMLDYAIDLQTRFVIADALYRLDGHERHLFDIMTQGLREGGISAGDVLARSYRIFSPDRALRIIDIALHHTDAFVRSQAFDAFLAVEYILAHGGQYTEERGREIIQQWIRSFTLGSGVASRECRLEELRQRLKS
jgi:hypothetical protein